VLYSNKAGTENRPLIAGIQNWLSSTNDLNWDFRIPQWPDISPSRLINNAEFESLKRRLTMKQDLIEIEERKICKDRSANFRGTACIGLEFLTFDVKLSRRDRENVDWLKHLFKTYGCYRLEPENRMAAIIDLISLENAVQASGTSIAALLKNPEGMPPLLKFPPNYRLKCLQGRCRIQAGKEFLSPGIRSWAVDLYLEGVI
jgi:Protein of unknown function (DUF3723)